MTPAFIYLRVSGLAQVEGQGFDRQLSACEAYALAHDIEVKEVYREEGITGKSELDDRPALQQLIADVLSNGVKLILIEKLDRLARDLIIQETIIRDLGRRGIQFISVAEPDLCCADPTRTLIRQILGAFFEYERKMIVSKLADARKRVKAKTGRCEGVAPYGSLPGEAQLLERILVLSHLSRMSADEIATYLNSEGKKTRFGKTWRGSVIRKILARERISPTCAKK